MDIVLDFIVNLDEHIGAALRTFGIWTYALLFAVLLVETGLVITMVLPGDELVFVAAALAVRYESLDIRLLLPLFATAAFSGDQISYLLGHTVGDKPFRRRGLILNHKNLKRAEAFYKRHGARAVLLGRFLPVVRGFLPFTAAVARMPYPRFLLFSFLGAMVWTTVYGVSGYYFGRLPFVRENLYTVLLAVACVSLLPGLVLWINRRGRDNGKGKKTGKTSRTGKTKKKLAIGKRR